MKKVNEKVMSNKFSSICIATVGIQTSKFFNVDTFILKL